MEFTTAWLCEQGGRTYNDDTVRIIEAEGTYVFVGDGLGGYAGGKQASMAAADALQELAQNASLLEEADLEKAAEIADRAVRDLQNATGGSMKTTLVFLTLEQNTARWVHVGDTRLYHFRDGKLQFQTMDHSVSQLAVLMGEIEPHEIRFHEDRNRILRALGAVNAAADVSTALPLEPGDAFLLCTDGFWELVLEEEMEQTLAGAGDPDAWLAEMRKILEDRMGPGTDNYSAAAVFCR
jgi:serine/threonine protein phosphatase PrpC